MNKDKILKLLADVIHLSFDELSLLPEDTLLSDLGLSSLAFIQFIVALEEAFSIEVLDSDLLLSNFQTIQLLFSTLEKYFQTDASVKKVLICDCDNCLWHGVAGEEDIYTDSYTDALQNELIRLQQKGILLCLCSKNESGNIVHAFTHLNMPLRMDHILLYRINRNNKADNILHFANELNLSTNSFVFLDDSDYELGLVNALLPEVTTIKASLEDNCISDLCHKLSSLFSQDASDLDRTRLYREQKDREKDKLNFTDVTAYNASLDTIVTCEAASMEHADRIAELSMRTNQCNLSCARYKSEDIAKMLDDKEYMLLSLTVKDKYGDMGLVGAAVIHLDPIPVAEAFFLSCRAFDRGFEDVLIETAKQISPPGLTGIYKESPQNKRFRYFYNDHGVTLYEKL